ncbi:MAG: hypothetical protein NC307_12175 [Roseburia sp.]|nr:hypothetical protein [Roseburia sp.]
MGDIVDFDLNRGKGEAIDSFAVADADFKEASKRLEENQDEETLKEFLKAMGGLAKEALKNPYLKELMDGADELYKEFQKRYEDIINHAPRFDAGLRMQYYAEVMLSFVQDTFHSGDRHYFWDFSDFYFLFDNAHSDYARQYKELEEQYPFTGRMTYDADELEKMVTNCLQEIIQLKPNDSDGEKTRLMYKASKLFEIYRNMMYYFDEQ